MEVVPAFPSFSWTKPLSLPREADMGHPPNCQHPTGNAGMCMIRGFQIHPPGSAADLQWDLQLIGSHSEKGSGWQVWQ